MGLGTPWKDVTLPAPQGPDRDGPRSGADAVRGSGNDWAPPAFHRIRLISHHPVKETEAQGAAAVGQSSPRKTGQGLRTRTQPWDPEPSRWFTALHVASVSELLA